MKLPVLIFDFGNVVSFFDYTVMTRRMAARVGRTAEELEPWRSDPRVLSLGHAFERGQMAPEEFARGVLELAGLDLPFEDFRADWSDIFTLNEPVARLIQDLKRQGYALLLGSNTNVLHADFYRRKFAETLGLFDHLVLSYEVGAVKPDRAFFATCVTRAGVAAESCVFIDDAEANVEGARAAGLHGVLYRDTPTLIGELCRLGVEVPGLKT